MGYEQKEIVAFLQMGCFVVLNDSLKAVSAKLVSLTDFKEMLKQFNMYEIEFKFLCINAYFKSYKVEVWKWMRNQASVYLLNVTMEKATR